MQDEPAAAAASTLSGTERLDVVVVGAGIVGLATAYALTRRPGVTVAVLEKEPRLAAHQSGRNSGVIHSGVYYPPGSLKAKTVAASRQRLLRFCDDHGIDYEICGKVIVATQPQERSGLARLHERGVANGLKVELIGPERLRDLEPHAAGIAALLVPEAGIADYRRMCAVLAEQIVDRGGVLQLGSPVRDITERDDEVVVTTQRGELRARWLINCAGLHSDRVAALATRRRRDVRIIPFRGEYYDLAPHRRDLVRNLIYPVPDPRFPFLGVHLTRMIGGAVHAGPNAVLALAREGYDWKTLNARDIADMARFPGLWRLAARHGVTGLGEVQRSLSKAAFVRALQRLVPAVRVSDLVPSKAGVRAQAIHADGTLVDDFAIEQTRRVVNVINAPSPAATASLEIGRMIADRLPSAQPR